LVTKAITPKVGAIGTVAVHTNKHVAAYERVVGTIVKLNKIDTNPHINNIIIRRQLMEDYTPPLLFWRRPVLQTVCTENRLHLESFAFFGCNPLGYIQKLCYNRHILSAVWSLYAVSTD
jgi:hypothetical protein